MSDTTTPDAPPTEEKPVDTDALKTAEYLRIVEGGGFSDGTEKIDTDAFDSGMATIVAELPKIKRAENGIVNAKRAIAAAMLAMRYAVIFKGQPDRFGQSAAYKRLFENRIVVAVKKANKGMDDEWIKKTLNDVRINYVNFSATRSKGMNLDYIVQDAAKRGDLGPGAKVDEETGKVTIPVTKKVKGETVPVMVKAEDGTESQKVVEYVPQMRNDVPEVVQKVVQDIFKKTAPTKTDQATGKVVPTTIPPAWMGGPAKDPNTGGNRKKEETPPTELYAEALQTIADSVTKVTAELAIATMHTAAWTLIDRLLKADPKIANPDDRASDLQNLSMMVGQGAKVLAGKAEVSTLDRFRPASAKEETSPTEETPAEDAPTEDDEKAAEEAAKQNS